MPKKNEKHTDPNDFVTRTEFDEKVAELTSRLDTLSRLYERSQMSLPDFLRRMRQKGSRKSNKYIARELAIGQQE